MTVSPRSNKLKVERLIPAAFANTLEMTEQATVFHEAEINEKQIDDRLSQLAEHEINLNARTPIVLQQG